MSKSSKAPILFSSAFDAKPKVLEKLGVFDVSLNIDTKLFPDPLLLENSDHAEMRAARSHFEQYFETVRTLVAASGENEKTKAWRSAYKLLKFPEVKGTCLGYGADSIAGSGVGHEMTQRLLATASEIVQLGIDDPDLFLAMGLFEEDFGPDLIGDMFTNVCFEQIMAFNLRVYESLRIKTKTFNIKLGNGKRYDAKFAENPCFPEADIPVILLPKDILQDLPLALDWAGVQEVSARNAEFRDNLNEDISKLWSKKTLESKSKLKAWALSGEGAFGNLLDMLHGQDGKPYDFAGDRLGEIIWRTIGERVSSDYPLKISKPKATSKEEMAKVVAKILEQYTFLIEKRDLWKDLYVDSKTIRLEQAAQRMFYSIAHSYCEANDLDISPEAYAGRGPVHFKFSSGFKKRILVEIKLSTNTRLVHGYEKQLALYDEAEKPFKSYFLILDVGKLRNKLKDVRFLEEQRKKKGLRTPEIVVVDGAYRKSASKA